MEIRVVEKIIDTENDEFKLRVRIPKEMVEEYEENELKTMVKSFIQKETMKMLDEYSARLICEWLGKQKE